MKVHKRKSPTMYGTYNVACHYYQRTMFANETTPYWKKVTCKNCLKKRPKEKVKKIKDLTPKEKAKFKKLLSKGVEKVCECRRDRGIIGGFHGTTEGIFCNTCNGRRA